MLLVAFAISFPYSDTAKVVNILNNFNSLEIVPAVTQISKQRPPPKKKCYIGLTRPTLKLGPTLHFFLNQKKKKKTKKWPTNPKKKQNLWFFCLNILFWL